MGFFVLALVMAAASTGSFLRRRWAWRLAIVIFIVNGLGDGVRTLSDAPMEGVFGVAVVPTAVLRASSKVGTTATFAPESRASD